MLEVVLNFEQSLKIVNFYRKIEGLCHVVI